MLPDRKVDDSSHTNYINTNHAVKRNTWGRKQEVESTHWFFTMVRTGGTAKRHFKELKPFDVIVPTPMNRYWEYSSLNNHLRHEPAFVVVKAYRFLGNLCSAELIPLTSLIEVAEKADRYNFFSKYDSNFADIKLKSDVDIIPHVHHCTRVSFSPVDFQCVGCISVDDRERFARIYHSIGKMDSYSYATFSGVDSKYNYDESKRFVAMTVGNVYRELKKANKRNVNDRELCDIVCYDDRVLPESLDEEEEWLMKSVKLPEPVPREKTFYHSSGMATLQLPDGCRKCDIPSLQTKGFDEISIGASNFETFEDLLDRIVSNKAESKAFLDLYRDNQMLILYKQYKMDKEQVSIVVKQISNKYRYNSSVG